MASPFQAVTIFVSRRGRGRLARAASSPGRHRSQSALTATTVEPVFEAARTGGRIRDLDWMCRRNAVDAARQLPDGSALFLNISAAALLDPVHGVDQLLIYAVAATTLLSGGAYIVRWGWRIAHIEAP